MRSPLSLVRGEAPRPLPPENAANHLKNAMQILSGIHAYEQAPGDVELALQGVEARLFQALNLLEPPAPPRGLPQFTGQLPGPDGVPA